MGEKGHGLKGGGALKICSAKKKREGRRSRATFLLVLDLNPSK
jgi:hypothetical protein